jgi:hypothetical protein
MFTAENLSYKLSFLLYEYVYINLSLKKNFPVAWVEFQMAVAYWVLAKKDIVVGIKGQAVKFFYWFEMLPALYLFILWLGGKH